MPETRRIDRRDFARTMTLAAVGAEARARVPGGSEPELQLGLYSVTYLGLWYDGPALTLETVVDRARKYDYQGVEVDGKRPHANPLDMPRRRCQELRRYAADRGIESYAVAANNDFSSPIPEHREAQLLFLRELVRMAEDLGAGTVRGFLARAGVTLAPEGGGRYNLAQSIRECTHRECSPQLVRDWCRQGLQEAVRYAGDHGVVLALQNHPPLIRDYRDMLRMIRAVVSPHWIACFDTRLEYGKKGPYLLDATREVGDLEVPVQFGDEYRRVAGRIVPQEDEFLADQVAGLTAIGYRGYLGYELCHPLPRTNSRPPGLDFVDRNVELAGHYLRETIAHVREGYVS